MKRLLLLAILTSLLAGCQKQEKMNQNPLLVEWETPYGVPPFDQILAKDFIPAFDSAMKSHDLEIDRIISNSDEANFRNTIVAFATSGYLLERTKMVFSNLKSANTNDSLEAIASEITPKLSAHDDAISMNPLLFEKIKTVFDKKDNLDLTSEERKLLEDTYKDFVRGGALLTGDKAERFKQINSEISMLTLKFGQNLLAETNDFMLVLDNDDLSGLPEQVAAGAAEAAKEAGLEGKYVFTLHKPSWIPFLTYSDRRDLREKIYKAVMNMGNNPNEHNNNETIKRIVELRIEKANLLGFDTYADFQLDDRMAKTPNNVYDLLNKLWVPARERAMQEEKDMKAIAKKEGMNITIEPWNWWYYAEKVRKEKYALDEELIRPYFKLENVRNGAFEVAGKLYGLSFTQLNEMPIYHEDVQVFEVKDSDGSHQGILYMDFFPRASKRSGAWMNHYIVQSGKGTDHYESPVISVVCNFSKPVGNKPALLSYDEVSTLFHEFGHALHGLLSDVTYRAQGGTKVPRDFVELPSQIMENWAAHPEVLKMFAKHYETGETMPDELIEKLQKSGHFNQGFATVEYLAASILDMDYHTLKNSESLDVQSFEKESMQKIGLINAIIPRYRSTYFNHIFNSGYSAGYYSYIWAEVMDADAFQAFVENGIFDKKTASSFRENILSKGGTMDAMQMYLNFRGEEPAIDPLLSKRGLVN